MEDLRRIIETQEKLIAAQEKTIEIYKNEIDELKKTLAQAANQTAVAAPVFPDVSVSSALGLPAAGPSPEQRSERTDKRVGKRLQDKLPSNGRRA